MLKYFGLTLFFFVSAIFFEIVGLEYINDFRIIADFDFAASIFCGICFVITLYFTIVEYESRSKKNVR